MSPATALKISDFLSANNVMTDVAAGDKKKLLSELSRKAGTMLDVLPEQVFSELIKREELGSTGMGGGVALPHARFTQLARPFGILVRLRKPLDFDAVDSKPVDLVFLLLLPESAAVGDQLGPLAAIARKLRNPAVTTALRSARDGTEMYRVLARD